MPLSDKLATSLHRRDEKPNQLLAREIAAANDKKSVKELFKLLHSNNKSIQSDVIKVIDEIAQLSPGLISQYAKELIDLLDNKNNRLRWGAMIALNHITEEKPEMIFNSLGRIIAAADKGTVITNDHCINILVKLGAIKKYWDDVFSLLFERVLISPSNQLPTYAEKALPLVTAKNKDAFLKILTSRIGDVESDTKRRRLKKLICKVPGY